MPNLPSQGTFILNAVTVTTTSVGVPIESFPNIVVQFIATNITSGNGVFTIDGSNDGTTWVTSIAFQDATATAATTWITSKTLSSAGSSSAAAYVSAGWKMIRVVVTVTTDGKYSALINAARPQ